MPSKFNQREENLIANFRGLPQGNPRYRDKGNKSLGSLLETCIEKYQIGKRTPEEIIRENWFRIVGEDFCKRCGPERIDHSGTLIVKVPNATVRREMIFAEDRMMTVIANLPECNFIKRIIFKSG